MAIFAHMPGQHWGAAVDNHDATRVPVAGVAEQVTFTPTVSRHIEFVTHDAGRQMIGSFHPREGDFFADCYRKQA